MQKIRVRKIKTTALVINRTATQEKHFVYIAVANKSLKYRWGRSKIVYIGQTKIGAFRLASSAATRAYKLLTEHGLSSLTYYIVVPKPRRKIQSWALLETALIFTFRGLYGEIPKANVQGKGVKLTDKADTEKHEYFTDDVLESLILHYSHIDT